MAAPKGNKFALGLENSGQPPVYNNKQELMNKIIEYFETRQIEYDDGKVIKLNPPSITGLALYLGFASRQSIYDYEAKEEYSYIIKRARLAIENHYEENLNFQNATGSIFVLKNMGWEDKREIDIPDGTIIQINVNGPNGNGKKKSQD